MRSNLKIWRESASLILAAKSIVAPPQKFNYEILCLKRSSKSQFMPETYVFPGGVTAKSDSSKEWLDLFEKYGFSHDSFNDLTPIGNIPHILEKSEDNELPKYLSLRICAIRETFEECGILLCKTPKITHDVNSGWASFIGGHELIKWQHRVHDDSKEFLNLCSQLDIYPDVWALNNWSNWVTPPSLTLKFNTLFFLVTLQQKPTVQSDEREVQHLMWTTPDQCIELNSKETILLPGPQFYEISRLKTMTDIEELSTFARGRSKHGCETYWPFRVKTGEGMYSILPGDDLYPKAIDKNVSEVPFILKLPDCKVKNRMLHKSNYSNELIVENLTPKCQHITPSRSKL